MQHLDERWRGVQMKPFGRKQREVVGAELDAEHVLNYRKLPRPRPIASCERLSLKG